MKLSDPKIPVLALVDHLESMDYTAARKLCTHSGDSALQYDERNLPRQRHYLQCVIALPDLVRAGVPRFQSGRAGA